MKTARFLLTLALGIALAACGTESEPDKDAAAPKPAAEKYGVQVVDGVKIKKVEGFGGVIAQRYEDSKEWWPDYVEPGKGAPNVIIFLLDDVGFGRSAVSAG